MEEIGNEYVVYVIERIYCFVAIQTDVTNIPADDMSIYDLSSASSVSLFMS